MLVFVDLGYFPVVSTPNMKSALLRREKVKYTGFSHENTNWVPQLLPTEDAAAKTLPIGIRLNLMKSILPWCCDDDMIILLMLMI